MTEPFNLSRRQFLTVAGLGAATVGIGAKSSGAAQPRSRAAHASPATVAFTTWAGTAEATAFKRLAAQFEALHKNIKINLEIVPYGQVLQGIDARLQAGNAPDTFRVTYTDLGIYSSKNALLDMSPYFDAAFKSQFQPAYFSAVTFKGKPFGIPHQTDTTALVYNKAVFEHAGIKSVPTSLGSAWSWEEFLAVAKEVQKVQHAGHYAFMYDWAQSGAFRWLTWLFEAGGNLLQADLKTPAINSPAGVKAVEFTQGFFTEGLVPPNTSTGNAVYPDSLFLAQTVGMAFAADFLLPGDIADAKFPWGVTFQPRDQRASSDLGGNGIVATVDAKNHEATAEWLKFMASRSAMATFCALTNELPTRRDLSSSQIKWAVEADKMPVFVETATTLTPFQVQQVTIPAFGSINTDLQNQLDAAFVQHQSASTTVANIASQVKTAIAAA